MPVALLWQESQNASGEECLAIAGAFACNEQRSKSAVWENGRNIKVAQERVIVSTQLWMGKNIECTLQLHESRSSKKKIGRS